MEPGLTDLTFIDVQEMDSIPRLWVEVPQEVAFSNVALSALNRLGVPQQRRHQV
jgi:hypothetical protein